ncbi:MAG: hypothetical protein ACRDOK_02310, partial [Streptosporangiaceae bacterium]
RLGVRVTSVQAVAHAFMMLGLLGGEGAEAAITHVRQVSAGLGAGGLAPLDWPDLAADYWRMRTQGPHALAWTPRAVAVGALQLLLRVASLRCDWFRLAESGFRFQLQAAAADQHPPARHPGAALAELSAADNCGRTYRLYSDGGRGSDRLWTGEVVAELVSGHDQLDDVAWFELTTTDAPAARVVFGPPAAIPAGTAAPAWPTPGECYLAWLSRQDPAPELAQSDGREVVAAVAESLVTVGAVPAESGLLPPLLGRHKRSSHPDLPVGWPHAVRLGTAPDLQIALCVAVPFEHAVAVIEGVSAWGEDIQLHVYGWPWIGGQQWPRAIPPFKVRAIDDLGHEHEGRAGSWREYGAGEAHGDFTLWPAVPRQAGRLHVIISTLWEAGWADIELPTR